MNRINSMITPKDLQKVKSNVNNNVIQKEFVQTHTGDSFNNILQKKVVQKEELQFSKHANMRLNSRDINLSDDQMKRLKTGVSKAETKGINDSLVIVDDIALVVNVTNKTVITALNKEQATENVFTNIDGAVIV